MLVLPLCYWLEDFRNWSVEVSFDLLVKLQWKLDFTIWGEGQKNHIIKSGYLKLPI